MSNDRIERTDEKATGVLPDGTDASSAEPTMVVPGDVSDLDQTLSVSEMTITEPKGFGSFGRPSQAVSEPTITLSPSEAELIRQQEEDAARREAEERAREEARLRAAERASRERALGTVEPPTQGDVTVSKPVKSTNDRFFGAFGLFLLRIVVAAVVGLRGIQILLDIRSMIAQIEALRMPAPGWIAWSLGVLLLIVAVMIFFGFATRFAAFLLAGVSITLGVLFHWKSLVLFGSGQRGFAGEAELLLAGIALLLLMLGAGGWSIDGGMRRAKAKRRMYDV